MKKTFRGCFTVILLLLFLSGAYAQQQSETVFLPGQDAGKKLKVGFDLDDTLLSSTPAFNKGFKSVRQPFSNLFWITVNKSDKGNSVVKKKAVEILKKHQQNGDEIYIITARRPYGTEPLIDFINETFKIKKENIYFAPRGKTDRIKSLGLDIFYGDSDSDISAAVKAGARAIRIMRSSESWNKKKYHPGRYNEQIIENSAE
jgi:acid phosphatase (class B)